MRQNRKRKLFIWCLTVFLFTLRLNTGVLCAASAAVQYDREADASAPGEENRMQAADTDQEYTENTEPASGSEEDAPSVGEPSDENPESSHETESFTGTEPPEQTDSPASPEETEYTEAGPGTEQPAETEHFTETGDSKEPETSFETEQYSTEAETITEEPSDAETLPETEEQLTETEFSEAADETAMPEETAFQESESQEEETEESSEKEDSKFFILLQEWWESMEMAFITKILQLILAFILFFVGRRIINSIIRVMDRIAVLKGWDPTVCSFARNAARAVLYLALVMSILTCVGVEVASLAAIISSIGVALGLALQGSLSNLAGGLLLAIMKPLHLGDFVSAAGYSGTVREIGLVYTTLVGADDRTVIIPNSTLMSSVIENYSEQTTRRVEVQCPISYDANLKESMNIFRNVLERIPERLPEKPVNVFIASFGDSGVVLEGQIYVRWTEYLSTLWKVREKIKLSFDEAGIEIPLPQIVVSMKQEK